MAPACAKSYSTTVPSRTPSDDIETVTSRIETASIDIAPTYAQWRDLGFALSDQLERLAETTITVSAVFIRTILRKKPTVSTTVASMPTAQASP